MERSSGILLPLFSLPSPYGIGTMGLAAYDFADLLHAAGQRYWQMLPLGPTSYGDSPYQSFSSYAGNPYLIDLDLLIEDGLLTEQEVRDRNWGEDPRHVDYGKLYENRLDMLKKAADRGCKRDAEAVAAFTEKNASWLPDYALFMALKRHFGMKPWQEWPDEAVRLHEPAALARYRELLREDVELFTYIQFLFFRQWTALKSYINSLGMGIIGDLPIYVAMDSADVWAERSMFRLDSRGVPTEVAGVPPDYFSKDGQLWGNPLYRWHYLRLHGYGFWMDRLRAMAQLYDSVRIDHFIGFANYYSVKAGEKTARNGKWVIGPGKAFFAAVKKKVPELKVVAEDLGAVNDRVRNLLAFCGYPGMKVLQFAYDGGGGDNSHQPQLYQPNCAAYTGTHDNDTSLGWWRACSDQTRRNLREALGEVDDSTVVWRMIKAVFDSRANIAMAPMQDFLGLDSAARMNTPGTVGEKNWRYRALSSDFSAELAARMRALCEESGRV